MNIKKINLSILSNKDLLTLDNKSTNVYLYLIRNSVAYFYTKKLSKSKNKKEKEIILKGDEFNIQFIKTLNLLKKISTKNKIKFLLFKTYKYIPEAVDGDIDIIVKKKDFSLFLRKLEEEGFKCKSEGELKAECTRKGFKKIEPRVNIGHHGFNIFTEKEIWNEAEEIKIKYMNILKTSIQLDLYSLLLNILYGPSYLKLYHYILYLKIGKENLLSISPNKKIESDIKFLINDIFKQGITEKKFPLFLSNKSFMVWWSRRILINKNFSLNKKLKHLVFFIYIKYKLILFNKLEFEHNWNYE